MKEAENNKKFNTIKFSNCFNTKGGLPYRHRQIRILQIGNACSAQIRKKQSMGVKSKPSTDFLNNELLKDDIQTFLKVEATKR